jgi:ABC-type nitrate/sulfonate/bicarbonate transport system permease component
MTETVAPSASHHLKVLMALKTYPYMVRGVSLAATLVIWELYGRTVDPIFMSYPTAIFQAVPEMVQRGELQAAVVTSLSELVVGLTLAISLGIIIGLLMGRYRTVDYLLDFQISALYSTPNVALIPLIILWFGLGFKAKVFIIFLAGFFPIIVNTYAGVRNVGRSVVDVALVEGASEAQIFTKIVIPASLPFIMTGIRLAMGRAIVGMVVAEMFTAADGLGGAVVAYGNAFATAKLFVIIIALAILGIALTEAVKMLERSTAPWKETERAS